MCMFDVQNDMVAPKDCVAGIQALLLTVMSNIVRRFLSKRYSDSQNADGIEEEKKSCFLDAAIGFCKLQHLDSTMSTKYQVRHRLLWFFFFWFSGDMRIGGSSLA